MCRSAHTLDLRWMTLVGSVILDTMPSCSSARCEISITCRFEVATSSSSKKAAPKKQGIFKGSLNIFFSFLFSCPHHNEPLCGKAVSANFCNCDKCSLALQELIAQAASCEVLWILEYLCLSYTSFQWKTHGYPKMALKIASFFWLLNWHLWPDFRKPKVPYCIAASPGARVNLLVIKTVNGSNSAKLKFLSTYSCNNSAKCAVFSSYWTGVLWIK